MVEEIGVMILVGAGGLMTIVVGTYVAAYAVDRLCSSPYPTERVFSPVSNRAGLWGMGYEERLQVLEQLFAGKKKITSYDESKEKSEPVEIEMTDLSSSTSDQRHDSNTNEPLPESDTGSTGAAGADIESGLGSDGNAEATALSICSICLAEFENGERVMTGTQCSHLYHVRCIMEWMQKGHDHCPFCRKTMMTPEDMRSAALQVLGQKRIDQLARPDVDTRLESNTITAPANNEGQSSPRGEEGNETAEAMEEDQC